MVGLPRTYAERADPSKHSLSNKERKQLIEADHSSYPEGTLAKRLSEKSGNITKRYEYLFEDIALLSASGHLKKNFGEKEWDRLVEAASDEISTNDSGLLFTERDLSGDEKIGFWVGQSLRRLSDGGQNESRRLDLVQGVALSLLGSRPDISSLPQIRGNIAEADPRIQEEIGRAEIDRMLEAVDGISEVADKRHNEAQSAIRALEMSNHIENKLEGIIERQLRSHEINPNKFLVTVMFAIMDKIKQKTGEVPYNKEIDKEIARLQSHSPLNRIEKLRSELISDRDQVDIEYRDVSVKDLLEEFDWELRRVKEEDIPSKIGTSGHVKGALNKLSDKDEKQLWTRRPIMREESERTWVLTAYGQLFNYMLFESKVFDQVLYEYAVYGEGFESEVVNEYGHSLQVLLEAMKREYNSDIGELIRTSLTQNE